MGSDSSRSVKCTSYIPNTHFWTDKNTHEVSTTQFAQQKVKLGFLQKINETKMALMLQLSHRTRIYRPRRSIDSLWCRFTEYHHRGKYCTKRLERGVVVPFEDCQTTDAPTSSCNTVSKETERGRGAQRWSVGVAEEGVKLPVSLENNGTKLEMLGGWFFARGALFA